MIDPEVREFAKAHAPDFYIAALLAPQSVQPHLMALAAFLGDVERITTTISEPAIAEIRLQWWRDTIEAAVRGENAGDPRADALGQAIRECSLPFIEFDGLLDARALDLYADPLPDAEALETYLRKTDGAAFRLAAKCLGSQRWGIPLVTHASQAYGMARLMRNLPVFLARGKPPFPGFEVGEAATYAAQLDVWRHKAREHRSQARKVWHQSPQEERQACLPIALVTPYLKAMERRGHDPARMLVDIEPLTRIWRIWLAYALGRV
jgi:15-cis-phytoene synthase